MAGEYKKLLDPFGVARLARRVADGVSFSIPVGAEDEAPYLQIREYRRYKADLAGGATILDADPLPIKKIDQKTIFGEVQTTSATPTFVFNGPLELATGYMAEITVVAVADVAPFDRATFRHGVQTVRLNGGSILDGHGAISPWPFKSAGASAWTITPSVSGNNLRVAVTGENSRAINWQMVLKFVRFNDDG